MEVTQIKEKKHKIMTAHFACHLLVSGKPGKNLLTNFTIYLQNDHQIMKDYNSFVKMFIATITYVVTYMHKYKTSE